MTRIDDDAFGRPDVAVQPAAMGTEDSIPAARLLAHDLEPLAWDDDGDGVLPPPD